MAWKFLKTAVLLAVGLNVAFAKAQGLDDSGQVAGGAIAVEVNLVPEVTLPVEATSPKNFESYLEDLRLLEVVYGHGLEVPLKFFETMRQTFRVTRAISDNWRTNDKDLAWDSVSKAVAVGETGVVVALDVAMWNAYANFAGPQSLEALKQAFARGAQGQTLVRNVATRFNNFFRVLSNAPMVAEYGPQSLAGRFVVGSSRVLALPALAAVYYSQVKSLAVISLSEERYQQVMSDLDKTIRDLRARQARIADKTSILGVNDPKAK